MSCAFGEIIFGWAWTSEVEEAIRNLTNEEKEEFGIPTSDSDYQSEPLSNEDAEALGFEYFYSASGDEVSGYLGVKLDDMNVYTPSKLADFKAIPSKKQREEVLKKAQALPKSLREVLGAPDTWVVWGDT